MYPLSSAMLYASSRSYVLIQQQRRWMSLLNVNTTAAITTTTTTSPPIRWISRRLLLQYQQYIKTKTSTQPHLKMKTNTTKPDETPWPRNIVYGTYVVLSICIPYSIAWFLSSNEPLRTTIFPYSRYNEEESYIMKYMRQHFGIPDTEYLSEPEMLQRILFKQSIPYRFIDEPTKRIRQQQIYIEEQQERNIKFQIISGSTTPMECNHVVELPAKTVARFHDLERAVLPNNVQIQPPIALDFDDFDDDDDSSSKSVEEKSLSTTLDDNNNTSSSLRWNETNVTVPSMSIYSLWHYQPPTSSNSTTTTSNGKPSLSPIQIELSRIQYELNILQQEIQQQSIPQLQQRSIDDIQDDIIKLKRLQRQLQWKKWFSWSS